MYSDSVGFTPGILFVDMNITRQIQGGHNLKEIQELVIQWHKLRYYDIALTVSQILQKYWTDSKLAKQLKNAIKYF